MSLRILWRSVVFILTLMFIYLAFPILIVPSSLPAIKAMFIDREFPQEHQPVIPNSDNLQADTQIYELNISAVPTLKDKLELIKDLHRQGMTKILPTN